MRSASLRRASLPLLLACVAGCGGDGPGTTEPDPPHAASVTLSETSLTLTYLNQTASLKATVKDQFQKAFTAPVTWSSADASIASVSGGGEVKAIKNGTTTLTATSGSLSATVNVTVQQVATGVQTVSGGGQTGTVGEALPEPVVVRSLDAGGSAVAGASVTFAAGGGGSTGVAQATTDAGGLASTTWTLGAKAGAQQLAAMVTGSTSGQAQVGATALAGPPSALAKVSGDAQIAPVDFPVGEPVVVSLSDAFGNPVAGGVLSFAVTGGGGSVTPDEASTAADGKAQATWTLGSGLGANTLSVGASGLASVEFSATAAAPKADLEPGAVVTSPANPTTLESVEVSTTVTNVGYLPVDAGIPVRLLVDGAEAGATTLPALDVGEGAEVSFALGPFAAGAHTLRVVVDPDGALDEWDETNNEAQRATDVPATTPITAGTPVSGISAQEGVELLYALEVPPSSPGTLEVRLSGGTGDVDLYVNHGSRPSKRDDYQCQSGNPTTTERCVINAAEPGTYYILLHAFTTFSGTTLVANTGLPVIPYDIEIVFIHHGTAAQDAVFQQAADAWMRIIPGDISDFDFSASPVAAGQCITGQPLLNGMIDDIRIYVDIVDIDGPQGTLAQAGPCFVRGLGQFPIVGAMQFDSADMDDLAAADELLPVVEHEMGHVLGIGTIWDRLELLRNPSLPANQGADTYFAGERAIAAFDAAGGGSHYTLGNKVPVQSTGGEGSADGHWRESVLGTELMTPFFNGGAKNPLSAITIESLADLGYTVDVTQAEPFSAVYKAPPPGADTGRLIDLGGDLRRGPIWVIDPKGRAREAPGR